MARVKRALLFALWLIPVALVGGWFTGALQQEMLPKDMVADVIAELGSATLLNVVSALQAVLYAVVCGFVG